jgi:hypothetical protein
LKSGSRPNKRDCVNAKGFETDWVRIRTAVVLPALEEVAVLLRKAGWQCEVRAGDKDPGVHFTVYRGAKAGMGRFPVTLYKEQWLKLLDMSAEIRAFIAANEAQLKTKD